MRKYQQPHTGGIIGAVWRWFDRSILALGREFRLSFMPPLMVYMAAGIAGITSVEVDLTTTTVTVDGEPLDDATIRAAIVTAGYEVA